MRKLTLGILLLGLMAADTSAQRQSKAPVNQSAVTVARLRYDGGGNWYWGRSAIGNLHQFLVKNTSIAVHDTEVNLKATDPELFKYPLPVKSPTT